MATAYGCATISSGRINTGVWQMRTKSRVTVKTKSGLVRYILVRNRSTVSGPAGEEGRSPDLHIVFVEIVAHLRTRPAGLRQHAGDNAIGRPPQQVPDEGAADAEAHQHELVYP